MFDPSSLANYRTISNLSATSKLLELILSRIHLHSPHLLHPLTSLLSNLPTDSVFLQKLLFHTSLTISLTYVANEIVTSWSVLTSRWHLTLSTTRYCWRDLSLTLESMALHFWLQSYLSNRTQYVKLGDHSSTPVKLLAGIPQGSVLGPLLFTTKLHFCPTSFMT